MENAEIVSTLVSIDKPFNTKDKRYYIADEFMNFYFKYIKPNTNIIKDNDRDNLFESISKNNINVVLELCFEKYVVKNFSIFSKIMGFDDAVINAGPYLEKKDTAFQCDLIYIRNDNVITLCEIKYHNKKISTDIIPEMERKINLLKTKKFTKGFTIERALICIEGIDNSLQKSEYFHHIVSINDFLP